MNIIVKTTLEQAIEDLKMIANPDVKNFELNQLLSDDINIVLKEIERLQKENNELRKLYQKTYKRLFEKGNDELARYFQAQIDECPTFYAEPIIDYYEETKRLNNIIKRLEEFIEKEIELYTIELIEKNTNALSYSLPIKAVYKEIYNVLQELKGSE